MNVLVLGGGAQGSAAAFDLARRAGVDRIVLADLEVARPAPFLKPWVGERIELRALDARDDAQVAAAMRGMDAVLCALPYTFNLRVATLAVDARAHYCDVGGNTEIVEQQRGLDRRAADAGLSVIPDCGVAPGMVNILAQGGIDALDRVESVRMFVGGLPQHPKPPLNYQIVYSLQGVLDYYTTPSVVLENGELATREALSEVEEVSFKSPLGKLEAFHTAGGASTMPHRYRGKIGSFSYKTLRYPGHAVLVRTMRDLGLFSEKTLRVGSCEVSPRALFIEAVSPKLHGNGSPDLLALRVEVTGETRGIRKTIRWDLLDRYDAEHGITAMMRTTGYSLAITTLMQLDGRVRERGVRTPDETMPVDAFVAELAERGVEIERTEL